MSLPDARAGLPTRKPLIFVVEDEPDIARLICHHLDLGGFATRWFPESLPVIEEAIKASPSLFVLDVMIPGCDGFELCHLIRQVKSLSGTPIIFLSAKVAEADRLRGLEAGGDDYIVKPFSPREMVARVRAVLRRTQDLQQPEIVQIGDLEINASSMRVRVGEKNISPTMMEFRLLHYFARHPGRVFTREQLLDAVWRESAFVTVRSVDVYVRRIREKIEPNPENPRYLVTLRGTGYRFDVPK